MAEYQWPKQGTMKLVGSSVSRIDGLEKSTGAAKYAYDINRPNLLFGQLLDLPACPCQAHQSLDVTPAKKVPGVVVVKEVSWLETLRTTVKVKKAERRNPLAR